MRKLLISCLIFHWFLAPLAFSATCSYPGDTRLQQKQSACTEVSKEWSCTLNRCVRTEVATQMEAQYHECEALLVGAEVVSDAGTTVTTEADRKACFDNIAAENVGELEESSSKSSLAQIVYPLTVSIALINFIGKGKGATCTSRKIFALAAGVGLISELYIYTNLDKKLAKLQAAYEKEALSPETYQAQLRALEYLKEEQLEIVSIANKKAKLYKLLTALYGASMVVAIIETMGKFGMSACGVSETSKTTGGESSTSEGTIQVDEPAAGGSGQTTVGPSERWEIPSYLKATILPDSEVVDTMFIYREWQDSQDLKNNKFISPSIEEYENVSQLSELSNIDKETKITINETIKSLMKIPEGIANIIFPKAEAKSSSSKLWLTLIGAGGGALVLNKIEPLKKFFTSSKGIALISGIAMAISLKLVSLSKKQAKIAQENADHVQTIITRFKELLVRSCPDGREDQTNTACFCMNDNFTQNNSRTNSKSCQDFWDVLSKNYFVGADDYGLASGEVSSGCLTLDGRFDAQCECRQFIDDSGANACQQGSITSMNLGLAGAGLSVSPLVTTSNDLLSGKTSIGSVNGESFGRLAIKNRELAEKFDKEFNKTTGGSLIPNSEELSSFIKDTVPPSLLNSLGNSGLATGSLVKGANLKGANNLAVKKALSEANLDSKKVVYNAKKASATRKKEKSQFSLGFSGKKSSGKSQDFMSKIYKTGQTEINENDQVSLFKIITRRYQVTGLRNLFE